MLSYYPPYELSSSTNLKNIRQTLINNGFPNYIVDTEIKQFIDKPKQPYIANNLHRKQSINLYYKNQLHTNYKIDEQILKNLIHKNVLTSEPNKKNTLIITTINLKPPI